MLLRTEVVVEHNLSGLRQAIQQLLPGARVAVSTVDGSIVLGGEVESPLQAQELRELAQRFLGEDETLLNRIRVAAPTQVHLRVRVAEVSRDVLKHFGINWEAIFQTGDFAFGLVSGRGVTDGLGNFLRAPEGANSAFGSFDGGDDVVNAALDALAEEGLVNVLAEPNLTALSGETASFLAGGEFPVPVGTENNDIQIEFKQFGVSLSFTPTVLSRNRIGLRVRPEVSDLSENGAITLQNIVIPALATRRAETTVELGSGQSFAIGGLISNSTRNSLEKVPGIGDLPILGTLFRSTSFRQRETELVIIVTPYLVEPRAERDFAVPTDGFRAPTQLELILDGRLAGTYTRPGPTARATSVDGLRLVGPAGFVID
jgi:pilus assembly protein CpaC